MQIIWTVVLGLVASAVTLANQGNGQTEHIQKKIRAGTVAIRGVNLGGWLVAERWMTEGQPCWNNVSDSDYLDRLNNDWAVKYNVAVMLSLHAHIWSQNGYDHSAPLIPQQQHWTDDDKKEANKEYSIKWAAFMAERYRTSDAFLGLNLMNEPNTPGNKDFILGYFMDAYKRIRNSNNNDCILVVGPQVGAQSPSNMQDFMLAPNYTNVWHEWHPYFIWGHESSNSQQIIASAKDYKNSFIAPWHGNPLFFGEWCLNASSSAVFTKDELQDYAESMLDTFKHAPKGWTFWSWRHSDYAHGKRTGWSLVDILREQNPQYQVHLDLSQ